jgi:hypothetical protein
MYKMMSVWFADSISRCQEQGNWRCSSYIHTKETRLQQLLDKSLDGPQNWFRHCDEHSNIMCFV